MDLKVEAYASLTTLVRTSEANRKEWNKVASTFLKLYPTHTLFQRNVGAIEDAIKNGFTDFEIDLLSHGRRKVRYTPELNHLLGTYEKLRSKINYYMRTLEERMFPDEDFMKRKRADGLDEETDNAQFMEDPGNKKSKGCCDESTGVSDCMEQMALEGAIVPVSSSVADDMEATSTDDMEATATDDMEATVTTADDDDDDDADDDTKHNLDEDEIDYLMDVNNEYAFDKVAKYHRYEMMRQIDSRSVNDLYITPRNVTMAITKYLIDTFGITQTTRIYDPCSGFGDLMIGFKQRGIPVIEGDIIKYYDSITMVENYLESSFLEYDLLVCNPPFSLKHDFLEKMTSSGRPFALLVPLNILCTVRSSATIIMKCNVICPIVGVKQFYNVGRRAFVFVGELCLIVGGFPSSQHMVYPLNIPKMVNQEKAYYKKIMEKRIEEYNSA